MSTEIYDVIPISDLPTVVPGQYDYVVVSQNGRAKKALSPDIVSAAQELSRRLDELTVQARNELAALILGATTEASLVLDSLGFLPPVSYASGLNISSSRVTVTYDGVTYSANSDSLPFTTGQTFDPSKWRVVQGVTYDRFVDEAGKRLDLFRSANLGEAHRSAPMCISLSRSTPFNLSNNNPSEALTWGTRLIETGVHWDSSAPSQIKIPSGSGGIWRLRASIEFPPSPTGHREVLIRRNGSTILARTCVPGIDSGRTQVVFVDTGPIACAQGQYFEVLYYQNSGLTQQGVASQTRFSAERLGDLRGRWDGVNFSADYSYRGDWDKYRTTGGTIIEGSGLSVVADPINPTLLAGRIRATKDNNSVLYPRVQAQTSSFITRTQNVYVALSIFIPEETHARLAAAGHGINIHEIYGPPFGTRSPNLIQYNPTFGLNLNAYVGGQDRRIWSLPPNQVVGKWVDIVHRVNMSTDPTIGYHELYLDIGDGNGRVQQTLSDGSQTGPRYYLATVLPGVNDGGNNFSSLKVSWSEKPDGTPSPLQEATIYIGEHRVGTDLFVSTDRSGYIAAY